MAIQDKELACTVRNGQNPVKQLALELRFPISMATRSMPASVIFDSSSASPVSVDPITSIESGTSDACSPLAPPLTGSPQSFMTVRQIPCSCFTETSSSCTFSVRSVKSQTLLRASTAVSHF